MMRLIDMGNDTLSIRSGSSRPSVHQTLEEAKSAFIRAPLQFTYEFSEMKKAYVENKMMAEGVMVCRLEEELLGRDLGNPMDMLVGTVSFISIGLGCGTGLVGPFADVAKLATARVQHCADEYMNDDSDILKRIGARLAEVNKPLETLVDALVARRKQLGDGQQKKVAADLRRGTAVENAEREFTHSRTLQLGDFKALDGIYAKNSMPLESRFVSELSNLVIDRPGMSLSKLFGGVCSLAAKSVGLRGKEAEAAWRIMELVAVRITSEARNLREMAPGETLAANRQSMLFEELGLLVLGLSSFWSGAFGTD
jgi:hypothetical protein